MVCIFIFHCVTVQAENKNNVTSCIVFIQPKNEKNPLTALFRVALDFFFFFFDSDPSFSPKKVFSFIFSKKVTNFQED